MMRRFLIWMMLCSASVQAQTPEAVPTGLGNLPPGFYPPPPCAKPVLEKDQGETRALAESASPTMAQLVGDDYQHKVENFNKGVTAYNGCAKTYIQNSRYDIERILSTVNAVVAEVRGTAPPPPPVGTGNLPADFYPRSSCVKPDQSSLGAQPAMTDIKAMTAYNLKVAAFNQDVVTFNACLKSYQDKAQHDIGEIQAAVLPPVAPARPSPASGTRPSASASQFGALPVESVVVTGASSEAVNHFVQSAATPTHIIGKVARWETPICPAAVGVPDDVIALVVKRVREVAAQAGVRVSSNPVCKPNIVIAFTDTPQALLDNIRKDHREWLGYHSNSEELDRLGTVTRPIQAWYSTATEDLNGRRQIDASQSDSNGRGLLVTGPCALIGGEGRTSGPNPMCHAWFPNAIKAEVKGSRVADGLRATFDHVTIIANPLAVRASMATIGDYIAVLALAQISSLDTCQALPSITSLLASGCPQAGTAITANDLGYLKAVYAANPEKVPGLQKNEIAYRMGQGIAGR